jgi:hypothetical protein
VKAKRVADGGTVEDGVSRQSGDRAWRNGMRQELCHQWAWAAAVLVRRACKCSYLGSAGAGPKREVLVVSVVKDPVPEVLPGRRWLATGLRRSLILVTQAAEQAGVLARCTARQQDGTEGSQDLSIPLPEFSTEVSRYF